MQKSKHDANLIAKTQSIYLRRFTIKDAEFMHSLMNEKGWLTHIGDRNIRTIKDAQQYLLKGPINDYEQHKFGLYLIVNAKKHIPVGTCGLLKRSYLVSPDIGFAVSHKFANKGYGFMAAEAVLHHAKHDCGLHELYATVKQDNAASQKLLKKIGFTQQQLIKVVEEPMPLALYYRAL